MVGKRQQLTDVFHVEAEVAGMAYEAKSPHRAIVVTALAAFGTTWRLNQAALLVKSNGRNLDSRDFCEPANPNIRHGQNLS